MIKTIERKKDFCQFGGYKLLKNKPINITKNDYLRNIR